MAGKSDYLENKFLDHVFRNVAYTSPATVYVGLYTAAPTDAGGGTEVSGNAYARKAVTCAAAASGGTISNTSQVTFDTPTPSGWGTVTHAGLFDASSGGNLLYWAPLAVAKTVGAGDPPFFAIGALVFTED